MQTFGFQCPSKKMLKILCLHGYRQNEKTFKDKLGSLRKIFKKHAELVFVTAPHISHPLPTENSVEPAVSSEDQKGWWYSTEQHTFNSHDRTDYCYGFEESLRLIEKTVESEGPFDGLLGFSQGACFVSILCHLQEKKELPFSFRFAIMIAGFKSRLGPHQSFYAISAQIPTLHVIGETDRIVEHEMSEELAALFQEPTVVFHQGGHFVAASSKEKPAYIEFLDRFMIKNT